MFGTWKYDPETDEVQSVRNGFDPVTARSSSHQACDRCHEKKVHLPPSYRQLGLAKPLPSSPLRRRQGLYLATLTRACLLIRLPVYSFVAVETRTAANGVGATVFVASTPVRAPRRRAIASPQTTRAFQARALVEGAVRPRARASTVGTHRE